MGLHDRIRIGGPSVQSESSNFDFITVNEKYDLPDPENVDKPTVARIEAEDDYGLVFDS